MLKKMQVLLTPALLFCLHNIDACLPSILYHLNIFKYVKATRCISDAHPVPALACTLTEVIALHNCLIPVLQDPILVIAEAKS